MATTPTRKNSSNATPVEEMLFMSSNINDQYEEMQEEASVQFAVEMNMRRGSHSFTIDSLTD